MANLRNEFEFRSALLTALGQEHTEAEAKNEEMWRRKMLDGLGVEYDQNDVNQFGLFREKLIEGVTNYSGGGGSSDFSTANVHIITNVVTGVIYLPYTSQLMGIETAHTQKAIENSTVTAVLYKGNAVLTCGAELYNQATVSGNAQKVATQNGFGYIKISGDCDIVFGSIS